MIRVRPEDIYVLRNSTGRPFTDHLDGLIRSSASVVGIVAAAVSDNPRTNVADGGADTEVSAPAPLQDRWGYFGAPSVWQYKAVEVGSLTDKQIVEEITAPSKQYVRDLLVRGYGYRFCICHDGTAERKAEIKAVLAAEIQRLNPTAPEPVVLFAKDIAEWTNAFPASAAELLHSELSGFSLFETWKTHERAKTPVFVSTLQSQTIRESVRQHLDWTQKPKTTKLTISGNAGVGKTRTVLEALTEGNDATGLVFYSDDEDRAIELAQNLKNNPEVFAVIVADECMETAAFRIGRALEGFSEAGSAVDLGVAVGRLDCQGSRMHEVVEACRVSRRAEFLRGYFVGLAESSSTAANPQEIRVQANRLLDDLWGQHASLAYAAMLASGTFLRAFARTIEAVSSGALPPRYLDNFKAWNGQRHTSSVETKIACETLLVLAKNGDAQAASIGLEFLQFLFMRNQDREKLEVLASLFAEDLVDVVFGLLEGSVPSKGRISHAFAQIFATIMELDPQRSVRLVMQLLRDKEYETAQLGSGLLASVAKAAPAYLMEQIGSAMLSEDRDLNFIIRKLPIAVLPSEVVIDWLKHHGVEGARILARHIPPPFVDNGVPKLDPITEFLLTQYGEDDAVYASFVAGLHSGGVFAGRISDWVLRSVALAEHFVTSPVPAVRKWASGEVEYGSQQAEQFRQQEEEEGF